MLLVETAFVLRTFSLHYGIQLASFLFLMSDLGHLLESFSMSLDATPAGDRDYLVIVVMV